MTSAPARGSRGWSVTATLVAIVATVAVGVGLVVSWRAIGTLEAQMNRALASKGEAIALSLAAASESDTAHVDAVQSLVDAHKVIYGVSYIFLLDKHGTPRIHTFSPTFPAELAQRNPIALGETLPAGQRVKVAEGVVFPGPSGPEHAVDVAAPIAGGILGTVHVGMSADLVDAQLAELRASMLMRGALVAALAILASVGASLLYLVRPMKRLTAFTQRIGEGHLEERAPAGGPLEVQALASAMNRMVAEIADGRSRIAATQRLQREMEIATRIQTSILPRRHDVRGLDLAARMLPATEVGGDYYDVLPVDDGCWIAIGDVTGHGLTAGLVMMMLQSVVAAMVRATPAARPRELVTAINRILVDNIRERLQQDDHVTFSLLRVYGDGRLVFAGAHEDMILRRAAGGVERVETPGAWLGVRPDIERATVDSTCRLEEGDVLVLFTDGVTEAPSAAGERFGMDRLTEAVTRADATTAASVRDAVLAAVQAWGTVREDDVTLVVARRPHAKEA